MGVKDLDLVAIIAFDGITKNGLCLHPDEEHFLYPMGNKVAIKHIESGKQRFLSGHTNQISALCVSPCGKYVASGQVNHLGFRAMVIVWDYNKCSIKGSYEIHKVRVEDVCFLSNSDYLVSLGGRDDGNVVFWDVHRNDPICGCFASNETAGNPYMIMRTNIRPECFVTAGDRTLKVWYHSREARKMFSMDVKVGKLRRSINCIAISKSDEFMYCGTSSGDIIKARLNFSNDSTILEPVQTPVMIGCYSKVPSTPVKRKVGEGELYAGGVKNILLLEDNKMIIGSGNGTVELVEMMNVNVNITKTSTKLPNIPMIKPYLSENVCSSVTSMIRYRKDYVLVGTSLCEIYQIKISNFDMRVLVTCHTDSIYAIAFPCDISEIFATAGHGDIRLWRLPTQKELLRISVPNFVCSDICFTHDGCMIISAWSDGVIRAFTPQSGQLAYLIHNAHIKAVTAVAITSDGTRLMSGGCDGQVRIWNIKPNLQTLHAILKEHKGPITSLNMSKNGENFISSSADGTCIIWDTARCARKQVLMRSTMFMAACFTPNGIQVLSCGTDRKIAYWETWDGSLVREVEGSGAGALNCINVTADCQYFITGSNDCVVKVWDYESASITHIGLGHASLITASALTPDNKHIVTVSADGAIMIWKCPFELNFQEQNIENLASTSQDELEELKLNNVKLEEENVVGLSQRAEATPGVKTMYEGNTDLQGHQLTEEVASICSNRMQEKSNKYYNASNSSSPKDKNSKCGSSKDKISGARCASLGKKCSETPISRKSNCSSLSNDIKSSSSYRDSDKKIRRPKCASPLKGK